mmetsp:Transcript_26599/g.73067  ORF Transcript_26599/g.73067 Transcript_26599/m.73067 type:complete len:229 (-) Transcript_26599:218-904(-)
MSLASCSGAFIRKSALPSSRTPDLTRSPRACSLENHCSVSIAPLKWMGITLTGVGVRASGLMVPSIISSLSFRVTNAEGFRTSGPSDEMICLASCSGAFSRKSALPSSRTPQLTRHSTACSLETQGSDTGAPLRCTRNCSTQGMGAAMAVSARCDEAKSTRSSRSFLVTKAEGFRTSGPSEATISRAARSGIFTRKSALRWSRMPRCTSASIACAFECQGTGTRVPAW